MAGRICADTDLLEGLNQAFAYICMNADTECEKMQQLVDQLSEYIDKKVQQLFDQMEELEAQIRYLRQKENVTAEDQQMIENLRKQKRMFADQVYIIRMSADNIRQKLCKVRQDQKLYHSAVINARKSLSHFIAILNDDGDGGGHNAAAASAMMEKDNGSSGFDSGKTGNLMEKREKVMAVNRDVGHKFEAKEYQHFAYENNQAKTQITIKTVQGTRFRVDAIGLSGKGKVRISEFKSSETAPLTKNQKNGFKELQIGGGVVVGKGKGIFTGGFEIPPGLRVAIVRPQIGKGK